MPIDKLTGIFYEYQSEGLCRMHTLNAFFCFNKISSNNFKRWILIYDKYLKKRFNISTSSSDFDLINSDQTNLVSFILKKYKIHTRYYALNSLYEKQLDSEVIKSPFIFVYNNIHMWGIRCIKDRHYKVDSIGGIQLFNIQELNAVKDIGIMLPVPLKYEWDKNVNIIKSILNDKNIESKKDLENYLRILHLNNDILGHLEIPICVSISIMETNMPIIYNPKFEQIDNLIKLYLEFLSIFTNGNYNKINLIIKYIPDIIFTIISLQ
jgi:hypothetical protein